MTSNGLKPDTARRRPPRRLLTWVIAGCTLTAALVVVVWAVVWRGGAAPLPPKFPSLPEPEDPRLSYAGPFLNVRPDVHYVGDDRCADCHAKIAESYHKHPMGRSLTPIAQLAPTQSYGPAQHNPFEALGSSFLVERHGDAVFQRQTKFDPAGLPIYENVLDVHYAIGSGVHGYSYLTDQGGYVFQTPISWFEAKQIWDLSPQFSVDYLTGRPILPDCLFCHANRTRPVTGTTNHYEEPLFQGYSIGCERCHGPGELHVQNPGQNSADSFDRTIVNPARLEPALRDAVCEQCHLEGVARIVRLGRDAYDFRPGQPLEDFLAVFIKNTAGGVDRRAVNHVEQMEQSGCFRGGTARERIGCISCHDPHTFVGPEERDAVYRAACLKCHEGKRPGCSVPVAERRKTSPDDSCIQCHMPSYATSDVVHTASTDHRIPRRPGPADAPDAPEKPKPGDPFPAVLFHFDRVNADTPDYRRDLGMALAHVSEQDGVPRAETAALLDEAVRNFPNDASAWEQRGELALLMKRPEEGLRAFEACLALAPEREMALEGAAQTAQALGKSDLAVSYWRRVVAVNPWNGFTHGGYANLLAFRQEWAEAQVQARDWVRMAPENRDARKLWIRCLLKTGDKAAAEKELKTLKALQPGFDRELDFWFTKQQR
jgi:predicted CXXCH cytochrome family protein